MTTGSGIKLKAEYGWNPIKYNIATHLKIAKHLLTTTFWTCYTLVLGSIIDVFRYIVQWHMGFFYVTRATCNIISIYFMLYEMMQVHVIKSDDFSCIRYAQCINMYANEDLIFLYQNLCNTCSKAMVIVPFSIKKLLNTLSSFWSRMGCLASWRRYIKNVRVQVSFRGKGGIILFSGVEIHFFSLTMPLPSSGFLSTANIC